MEGAAEKLRLGLQPLVTLIDLGAQGASQPFQNGLGVQSPFRAEAGDVSETLPVAQAARKLGIVP